MKLLILLPILLASAGCMRLGAPLGTAFNWDYSTGGPTCGEIVRALVPVVPHRPTPAEEAEHARYGYRALLTLVSELPTVKDSVTAQRRSIAVEPPVQAFIDADGNRVTGYGPRGAECVCRDASTEGRFGAGGFGAATNNCWIEVYNQAGDVLMSVAPCAAWLRCYQADYDCDGDVDLRDFGLWQMSFTGPR